MIVVLVLAGLAVSVTAALAGGDPQADRLTPVTGTGAYGILQAAGLIFFAFAGYARIATLGEEVRDPARTIPKAIPIALGIVLAVYAVVAVTLLAVLGADRLAAAAAPLAAAVQIGSLHALTPVVRVAAAIAALGVLLSLIAGVGRTAFAMASNRELPHVLATVHPKHKVPWVAEVAVGAVVAVLAATLDLDTPSASRPSPSSSTTRSRTRRPSRCPRDSSGGRAHSPSPASPAASSLLSASPGPPWSRGPV